MALKKDELKTIEKYARLAQNNDVVEQELYSQFGVKRGLRDINGRGVVTGITNIFEKETIKASIKNNISTFKTDKSYYLIDSTYNGETINYVQDYQKFTYQNTKDNILKEVNIYTINQKTLEKIYNKLKTNQIKYTYYSDLLKTIYYKIRPTKP